VVVLAAAVASVAEAQVDGNNTIEEIENYDDKVLKHKREYE